MKEIKPKLIFSMPPATAKKKLKNDYGTISLKNRNDFHWKFPTSVIEESIPQEEITKHTTISRFIREDLWELMDKGNWRASDIAEMIGKPVKTIKRWANRNSDGKHDIPLSTEQYKILSKKFSFDKQMSLPLRIF